MSGNGRQLQHSHPGACRATHIKVTTLMPIAAAPAAPPPKALLRLLSRISWVVGGAFAGELELDMVALLLWEGRTDLRWRRADRASIVFFKGVPFREKHDSSLEKKNDGFNFRLETRKERAWPDPHCVAVWNTVVIPLSLVSNVGRFHLRLSWCYPFKGLLGLFQRAPRSLSKGSSVFRRGRCLGLCL